MKVVFTIVKQQVEKGIITGNETKELLCENVEKFQVDDGLQEIVVSNNDSTFDTIPLQTHDGDKAENWVLIDIKIFEVPLVFKG